MERFHSTVLQKPPLFANDEASVHDDGARRSILTSGSSLAAHHHHYHHQPSTPPPPSSSSAPPPSSSNCPFYHDQGQTSPPANTTYRTTITTFSLRSPIQPPPSNYRHVPPSTNSASSSLSYFAPSSTHPDPNHQHHHYHHHHPPPNSAVPSSISTAHHHNHHNRNNTTTSTSFQNPFIPPATSSSNSTSSLPPPPPLQPPAIHAPHSPPPPPPPPSQPFSSSSPTKSSSNPTATTSSSYLQQPLPPSPLHAPPVFYPPKHSPPTPAQFAPDHHQHHQNCHPHQHATRDSAHGGELAGSFYDPTTDTTTFKSRGLSYTAARHEAKQSSPLTLKPSDHKHNNNNNTTTTTNSYAYSKLSASNLTKYNHRRFTSSPTTTSYFPPQSPGVSQPQFTPITGSISPPSQPSKMQSPVMRHTSSSSLRKPGAKGPASISALPPLNGSDAPVLRAPATATATRGGVMSVLSMLSNDHPAKPSQKSPPIPTNTYHHSKSDKAEKLAKAAGATSTQPETPRKPDAKERSAKRKSRHSASGPRTQDAPPGKTSARGSSAKHDLFLNGYAKSGVSGADKERQIRQIMEKLDAQVANALDAQELDEEEKAWREQCGRRHHNVEQGEWRLRQCRRADFVDIESRNLKTHSGLGKRRYDDMYYDEALQEVRDRELFAEKERKKDMQRKRRREKSMANTLELEAAALARALQAEDEAERQKHLREAERAKKKVQQTKMILQKDIKGPTRNMAPVEPNHEGGTMATFRADNMEPGKTSSSKTKRSGTRPKKSKEQKQAEKDSAEAAQAALDAGEELPSREETKIRIKLSKTKSTKGSSAAAAATAETPPVDGTGPGSLADETEIKDDEPNNKKKKKKKKDKEKIKDKDKKDDAEKDKGKDKDKEDREPVNAKEKASAKAAEESKDPLEKFQSKGFNQIYDQIWRDLARKDIGKVYKMATDSYATKSSNLKKTAILAAKEAKRWQLRTNKGNKDLQARAKRVMRDMMSFWRRNEREERDLRKAAEKQELENARREEADREAARQKRKLNFLISQTELYSHFIGKKIKTQEVERSTDRPDTVADEDKDAITENRLNIKEPTGPVGSKVINFENLDFDAEDETALCAAAMANAQNAIAEARQKARDFNRSSNDASLDEDGEMNFQNPTGLDKIDIEQPKLLNAQLKEYQLKGLNWLVNLYEQGINGILADEMGLGKTVQSISVMAYLAEKHDIWGPFLVVAPASTLHNWQQEIRKFVPDFNALPYWGTTADRKVLRKCWDRKHATYKRHSPYHVMITSYQFVVQDVAYFQKMKWQYMILDEAQAIKSSQSSRWKCLLSFHCRNRLLLTGTPIQNNMQELWALLHFIMPSLFDSHDEFSEWFSKDIESHAQSNTKLNEDQLKRLHMILKPFMLRRVKKHVQKELGDKIEIDVFCDLSYRQRAMYSNLRNQISIMDLIEKATIGDDDSTSLMNLVMQFRKVCNHPDLFERAETMSPYSFGYFAETASFAREGSDVTVGYSSRSLIEYELPRLVYLDCGRLSRPRRHHDGAGFRRRALDHLMNIWTPDHVHESLARDEAFSWLRFADVSAQEVYAASHTDVFTRATRLATAKADRLGVMRLAYDEGHDDKGARPFVPAHALFLVETAADRAVHMTDMTSESILTGLMNVSRHAFAEAGLDRLEQAALPGATAPPIEVYCRTVSVRYKREDELFNARMRRALFGPTAVEAQALVLQQKVPTVHLLPPVALLPAPDNISNRFTNITVPSMSRFVTDSGKLAHLDSLLFKLKEGGHRVLLYFQMTRMIDLMEEYLTFRNYKYRRLDGSTKLSDRRDTVEEFQTRSEIFVFLLSTRAGGLGINLTSADTVIFYDSDWNPTIDSQAMDRAHRLGQTRQVTVYRLITRGTIEERIRKRALQKEEVQRVVITGGRSAAASGGIDFSGRRAPENRNRDIAMWLADDEQAEMIEQREKELIESGEYDRMHKKRGGGGKRKRAAATGGDGDALLEDLYHDEEHFDDGGGGGASADGDHDRPGKRKRTGGSKKAKTTKQRLAIADGQVDI